MTVKKWKIQPSPKPHHTTNRETCLKHNDVQGGWSFLTFERYFQNFYSVLGQLCDMSPWQFFVIVHGCGCFWGGGGGGHMAPSWAISLSPETAIPMTH